MKALTLQKLKELIILEEVGVVNQEIELEDDHDERIEMQESLDIYKEEISNASDIEDMIDAMVEKRHEKIDAYDLIIEHLDSLIN